MSIICWSTKILLAGRTGWPAAEAQSAVELVELSGLLDEQC